MIFRELLCTYSLGNIANSINVCAMHAFPVIRHSLFIIILCYLLHILFRLFSMSKNPKKSFQRFAVSPNSQCICAFGSDKNCVVGECAFLCVQAVGTEYGKVHV